MQRDRLSSGLLFDLGYRDYQTVWQLQHQLVENRAKGGVPDSLILVEHPHVITLGRRASQEDLQVKDIPVYKVERGGDATYHGPGQLVGYPIVSLEERAMDIQRYLRALEEVLISAVARFGLKAERSTKQTGVWVGEKKLASIGVALKNWIAYHGFALNVNTELSYFWLIKPCGLDAMIMTSMKALMGCEVSFERVKQLVRESYENVFGIELSPASSIA